MNELTVSDCRNLHETRQKVRDARSRSNEMDPEAAE